MTQTDRDGAAVRIPPPLVYVGAVAAGILLHWIVPLALPFGAGLRWTLAAVAALLGAALVGSALGLFRSTGQDPKPWVSTPEILSTGVYRWTRNPMYLGMALIQLAIGVALANGWIAALVPVSMWLVQTTAIGPEEAYLERKFGAQYLDYKHSVRRWL